MNSTAAHGSQRGFTTFSLHERGFTLIELIIVVAIIAILSSIGLTVYSGIQRGARDSKRQSDILEIQKALEQFYALNRTYPPSLSTLVTAPNAYFPSGDVPHEPLTTMPDYVYQHCGAAERYVLCTGAAAMETCTPSAQNNCNASSSAPGCGQFTSTGTRTLFCAASLSN